MRDSFPPVETIAPLPVRAVMAVPPLRDAVVATTLSNPHLTGWLLSKLVSNREAAVTPERVAMLQRPFALQGWTRGLGEWLAPFATTRTSSMATDRPRYATLSMPALVMSIVIGCSLSTPRVIENGMLPVASSFESGDWIRIASTCARSLR